MSKFIYVSNSDKVVILVSEEKEFVAGATEIEFDGEIPEKYGEYIFVDEKFSINPERIKENEELEQQKKLAERKMHTDYKGTNISLTSKDAIALLQIKAAFELGADRTVFKFENGTKMEMTPEMFPEFAAFFVKRRNEFFKD